MVLDNQDELIVDFAHLAQQDEQFGSIFESTNGHIDFQDPTHLKQLTKSILKCDFGLNIDLPDDRLCPPVPIRYEYIRWLQCLLDTTDDSLTEDDKLNRVVIGVDIGVGASCIYPLLGCTSRSNWNFAGTELDQKSFEYATYNRDLNGLQSKIRLLKVAPLDTLINLAGLGLNKADFVMCNPPFFGSKYEMLSKQNTKKRAPSAVCTGAEIEMISKGGDLEFVLRMFEESKQLRHQVQWYSSMLGNLSSVYGLVKKIKEYKITNWAVTTLQAGNVTRRWVVAWSFHDQRPANNVARKGVTAKEILPFPTEYTIPVTITNRLEASNRIDQILNDLDVLWNWTSTGNTPSGTCFAAKNVWSRSVRRRKELAMDCDIGPATETSLNDARNSAALGVRISVTSPAPNSACTIILRWLKGSDTVLFESFCGMMKRSLTT